MKKILLLILLISALFLLHFNYILAETVANPVTKVPRENIYRYSQAGMYADVAKKALYRVYVPNSRSNTVSVIDPLSFQVVSTFNTGKIPQHVVPSYDLTKLYVLNNSGNSLTVINPYTAQAIGMIKVDDPYNLYFTPDGHYAIVVCENHKRLEFRDPLTFAVHDSVPVMCKGINHMEFTVDGQHALVTCEFSGELLKINLTNHKIEGYLDLGANMHSMPQDIRSSPNGSIFYVADMMRNGVFLIDPMRFVIVGFVPTGIGAHGLYPSRDGKFLYIANRGCQSHKWCPAKGPGGVSVLDFATNKIIAQWPIPGGGSPDMGNISGDGKELWLSGRYDKEVYVIDTKTGQVTHRIPVGREPHGLTVWPQPGRYSLGHTGNMR